MPPETPRGQQIAVAEDLVRQVEIWLDRLYIAAEGAGLRVEDRRKAIEVAAMLVEIGRCAAKMSARNPVVLVDAAAGKSYVGLLAAKLIFEAGGRDTRICAIERDAVRAEAGRRAAARLETDIAIEVHCADLAVADSLPANPTIVAALHACGPAADAIIDRAIERSAKNVLLVPCCTSTGVAAVARAEKKAALVGLPRHAQVRRRFIQACVDAERTLRLEAAGYETEVVELVGARVTPHNLLWRARLVGEPRRVESAKQALSAWLSGGAL